MKNFDHENAPLKEIYFSKEFIVALDQVGVTEFSQLLQMSRQQLMDIPNFTFHMLCEYREFLATNGFDTK